MTEAALRLPLLLGIGAAVLATLVMIFRWSPKTLMATWALTFFFVPIWVGAQIGVFYSAITVVTLLAIASSSLHAWRWSIVDLLLGSFTFLLITGWTFGWIQWGHLLIAVVGWMVPYLGGRLISSRVKLEWIYTSLASGVVTAAVLAIAEFFSGINVFVLLKMPNNLYQTWHVLQYRGGQLRVEGAFGHSIAFGACLALCSVFILMVRWPQWLQLLSLLAVALATGLTFSRIGLICFSLTLVTGLVVLGRDIRPSLRWKAAALSGLAAVVGIPLLLEVFSSAGSEAAGSAAYRGNILSLFDTAALLGVAKSWRESADGTTYYGTFRSIDSELILTALRFGTIPLLLLLSALACALIAILRNRATPASVAVIGFIPAFATVAMITQYATLVWFLAGLAVATFPRNPRTSVSAGTSATQTPVLQATYRKEARWLQ